MLGLRKSPEVSAILGEEPTTALERCDAILIGASVRAAAFSALRAGFRPGCIDLFADADLRAVAPTIHCLPMHFPHALPEMLENAPRLPVFYTGGLENYPKLIGRIGRSRPLWGNDADALARSRSPAYLSRLLQSRNLPAPEVRSGADELPGSCRWLRKPLAGSAGFGIRFAEQRSPEEIESYYHQEFIPGASMSASYRAVPEGTELLGVTEQLIGESWLHAPAFRYCGNIGPVSVTETVRAVLIRIGETIASGCGLRGLFGIDFILCDDTPWLVEVNPRYTASMEVLERVDRLSYFALHRAAFEPTGKSSSGTSWDMSACAGKAILYAPRPLTFPPDGPWTASIGKSVHSPNLPAFADVPQPGTEIEAGWPIMTLLVENSNRESCRRVLRHRADELARRFGWDED